MLQYLVWRVVTGLNLEVELSFLPVGHIKFRPDACFGTFKKIWLKAEANCLKDVCRIATKPIKTAVVLVGDEAGTPYVKQYDWAEYFGDKGYHTVPNIRKGLHFRTDQSNVGFISSKNGVHLPSTSHLIMPDNAAVDCFPEELLPPGLPKPRKTYLYTQIRKFVKPRFQDVLCP